MKVLLLEDEDRIVQFVKKGLGEQGRAPTSIFVALQEKLGSSSESPIIETVRGIGYRVASEQ